MDRRKFLEVSGLGMLAASMGACAAPGLRGGSAATSAWGLQMFTVLPMLQKDFAGTFKAVADLGYRNVETIGSLGAEPRALRELLDRCGLKSPSQHIASEFLFNSFSRWAKREISTEENRVNYVSALQPENVESLIAGAIAQARILGQQYLTWPILLAPHIADRKLIDRFTKAFDRAGAMCRDEGLTFVYHNHAIEFGKIDGEVIYDILLAQTDPALMKLELDFYWFAKGAADPYAYLSRNKGRYTTAHVKDMNADGDFAVVGGGMLDVPRLIRAGRAAGMQYFFVEYDRSTDPMREIAESIRYLNNLPN